MSSRPCSNRRESIELDTLRIAGRRWLLVIGLICALARCSWRLRWRSSLTRPARSSIGHGGSAGTACPFGSTSSAAWCRCRPARPGHHSRGRPPGDACWRLPPPNQARRTAQLINVLRGEMSLVGPRPEDPAMWRSTPESNARSARSSRHHQRCLSGLSS